eukprot:TRINITY_DN37672_c0_g1_i2.p3 TRINITY_DN37672_c0_g1~~TRINITY_DN37672_c0_g1_i2.p3  ORF type:complete len:111 (+),score=26.41 TRINITY_DN37672_c0_g1_i2:62-394(+)
MCIRDRIHGVGLEFRMELATQEPGMARQLDDLHQGLVRRGARKDHAVAFERLDILVVELETVAMALVDVDGLVGRVGCGFLLQLAGIGPCLLYTSPSPRDLSTSRMPSSA